MSKSLVAYFSATGTTKAAAMRVAALTDSDVFEISPVVLYETPDLDWTDAKSRTTLEMKDPACRPEINPIPESMNEYERIYLGFPIWWYTAPRIAESFLDKLDLGGKVIIPFATSGGSPLGTTVDDLRNSCGGTVLSGLMIKKSTGDDEIRSWAAQA